MVIKIRIFAVIVVLLANLSQTISQNNLLQNSLINLKEKNHLVSLDYNKYLDQAKSIDHRSPLFIYITILGENYQFKAIPNFLTDDEFSRSYPGIYSFDIQCDKHKHIAGTMTLSSSGMYFTLKSHGKIITIYPAGDKADKNEHVIDFGNTETQNPSRFCTADHPAHGIKNSFFKPVSGARSDISIGERLYNYRLAVVVTGEFYKSNGNNDTEVLSVIINSVNSLNVIYNSELSFRFSLGNRIFLYKDAATDPFTPDMAGGEDRTTQAGKIIPTLINKDNFDIGHVFHTHKDGDSWTTGGIAFYNGVCSNSNIGTQSIKASGWSGYYINTGSFWANLLAHEVGHQFSATHTFNGSGTNCDNNIDLTTAVEIGSGSTIMSYFGACETAQNIPWNGAVDNYFHSISLEQMYKFVYEGNGGGCGNPQINANKIPQVIANSCNANLKIPKNTPFYLKAKGSWTDDDKHTYCWEQIDEDGSGIKPTQGQIGNAAANSLKSPLFRSFPPSKEAYRFFPSMDVLNSPGGFSSFEVLPAIKRELNFNVSIRDNNINGGAISNDELTIQVDDSGPFKITKPIGGETFLAGQTETLTWNTNGSNALCNKVRIKMSVDGGKTFPIVIAENVEYSSGRYAYSIPQNFISSGNAKIIIECMDFDCFTFFDISRGTFSINSACAPNESILCRTDSIIAEKGSAGLNLNMPVLTGQQVNSISKSLNNSSSIGNLTVFTNDFKGCKTVANSYFYQKSKLSVSESGIYNFKVDGPGCVSIFSPKFSPTSGCIGFISSSARESSIPNSITYSQVFSVDLRSCTEYEVVFYALETLPKTISLILDSGPGVVFEPTANVPIGYQHLFILVERNSGNIANTSTNSDFRTTKAGTYTLYSTVIPTSINPNSLLNQNFNSVIQTLCLSKQINSRTITILPTCEIKSLTAGVQSTCLPSTNRYSQNLTITYENPPTSGKLNINGQLFDINTSPQNITLSGLEANSKPVNITAFFTADETCMFRQIDLFTAAAECCPITLDLGSTIIKCQESGTVKLEAGLDTTFQYNWFKDGQPINSNQGGILFVSTTGLYGVQVVHPNGCAKTDTVMVIFHPRPQVTIMHGDSFCENEKYTLQATVSPLDTIKWLRNDTIIPGALFNNLEISKSGTYTILVKNSFGCENQALINIQTKNAPKVELGPNLAKCQGDNVILNAGNGGNIYQWYKDNVLISTGTSETQFTVTTSGNYKVIVKNEALCTAEDQVNIEFIAPPVVEDFPLTVNGCQGTELSLEAKVNDFISLQWYYDNNPIGGAKSIKIPVFNSGAYSVEATGFGGCRTRKGTNVEIRPLPVVNLGPDITVCERTPILLFAGTEGILYEWSRNNIRINNPENTLPVLEGGLYKVSVTNSFKCVAVVQKRITYVTGPPAIISNDTSFCDGLNHTIRVSTNAINAKFQWYRNTEPIEGNGPELNVTLPGNYEAWVTAGNPACTTIKTTTITVHPKPAFSLGNDRVLCDPTDFPVLNGGTGNVQFQWSLNGTSISNDRTVTADKSGIYLLKVKNNFGCERTDQVKITISSNPLLILSQDSILCEGSSLNITSQTTGTKFIWRRNNVNIPNATLSNYSTILSGLYTLVSANDVDCRTERSINVILRPKPIIKLGSDTSLCPGQSLILNAGNHKSYLWSNGTTNATLSINAGNPSTNTISKYIVTVNNEFNCTNRDSIIITNYAAVKAGISVNVSTICKGDSVLLTASGGENFKWTQTANGALTITNQAKTSAKPTANSTYTVEVNNFACPALKDIASIDVKLFETAKIDAGRDTCTISQRPVRLNASGGAKYRWDNTSLISGLNDIPNPTVITSSDVLFKVTITDTNGCEYVDSVKVCIKPAEVTTISVITPNNDGKNDELVFPGLELFPGNKLTIFNRWGNVIFEAEDYQIVGILFNGERNGERLPPDTYYYVLQYDKRLIKNALTIIWD